MRTTVQRYFQDMHGMDTHQGKDSSDRYGQKGNSIEEVFRGLCNGLVLKAFVLQEMSLKEIWQDVIIY